MIKQVTATALGLVAILGVAPARGDYVAYTNRASFEAAITGEKTETFDELGAGVQFFGTTGLTQSQGLTQPLAITSSSNFLISGSSSSLAGMYPTANTYLIGPTSSATGDGITVTLPPNTYNAAGADVANFASNSVVTMTATTSSGISFTSKVAVNATLAGNPLGFLGAVDTTPGDYITSLTFSAPVGSNQNVLIDNFSFGFAPQVVPEPTSVALMVVGSVALGAGALRRRFLKKVA